MLLSRDLLFYEIGLKHSTFYTLVQISMTCKKMRSLLLDHLTQQERHFRASFDANVCQVYNRFMHRPIVDFSRLMRAAHFYEKLAPLSKNNSVLKNFLLDELFPTCYYYDIGSMAELYYSSIELVGCGIEKDIQLVQSQIDCTRSQAIASLIGNSMDVVDAILRIDMTLGPGPTYSVQGGITRKIENGVISIL